MISGRCWSGGERVAYDIGPKIGIDGEAEFRAQIKAINTSVRTLGTEMEAVTSAFIGQEKSTEALSAKNQVLAKTVSELDSKLELQKKMLAEATATYGEADARTQQWQQAVNKTTAELNKANAQIDANEQALQDDGKAVVDTAEKHEGAMSKIGAAAKAGLGAATDVLKGLTTATVAAVGAATAAVTGLVKESIAGYGEYEQLIGGVETLFQGSSGTIQKYANDAYKTAGLSANEYMKTVTGFAASLVQSFSDTSGAVTEEMAEDMIAGLDEQYNAQKEASEKAVASLKESFEERYDAQKEADEKTVASLKQSLDAELEAQQNATDQKIALINEVYKENLKLINEEEYNRLKAIDDEIAALNAQTQAEKDALEERNRQKKIAELQAKVSTAKNDEDRKKAEESLQEYLAEIERKEREAARSEQIKALKEEKQSIKDEAETKRDSLKEQTDNEISSVKEVNSARLKEIKQAHDGELTELKKANSVRLEEMKQAYDGELKALEKSNDRKLQAMKDFNGKQKKEILASVGVVSEKVQLTEEQYAAAAEMADLAITDMADNANKMGTSMESIQNAYQGFAKQNYTMLDNLKLGYGGTKEEMQRLLSDAQKLTGKKFDLSNYADIVEAIHAVQTEMGITGTTAAEASQTIEGSVTAAKTAWQNLVVGLAGDNQNIEQLVTNLVGSATTALGNIIPVAETTLAQLGPALQAMMPMVMEFIVLLISSATPQLVEGGVQLLGALVQGITASLPSMGAAAEQLIELLLSELEVGLPKIAEEGPGAVMSFTSGVTQALPAILAAGASIIIQLIEGLTANEPALMDSAANILGSLASGLGAQMPVLVPVALDAILTLASSLVSNAGQLSDSAISLVRGLASGVVSSIPVLAEKAPQIVVGLVNSLVENTPKIVEEGAQIIGSLVLGIIDNLPQIGAAAIQIVLALGQGVLDLGSQLLQIGGNIVLGVWNGIAAKVEWFKDQVAGFFGGIVDGVKDLLGIQSPSKVFAGIGENMALGLGKGWDREIDGIRRDIENGVDFSGLQPEVNAPAVNNMPGLTMGMERPDYQGLLAAAVNGMQTATAGNEFPQSATIILQAGDGMTLARWILPDLRSAMRDDPEPV